MSSPDHPRESGFWTWAPFVVIALLLLGYTAGWFWVRREVERRLEAGETALRAAGYTVEQQGRRVGGFPLRLRVRYQGLKIAGPSGWAATFPELTAEAYVYAPTHWVLVAPQGLRLDRPLDGPLQITGDILRASVSGVTQAPWRVSVEGSKLKFTPGAIARSFTLDSADHLEAHLRPADDGTGEGELLIWLQGAQVSPNSVLWRLTENAPLESRLRAKISKPAAFSGEGWSQAVRSWAEAGGELRLVKFMAQAGRTALTADGGELTAAADGRLEGELPFEFSGPPGSKPSLAMAEANDRPTAAAVAAVEARRSGPAPLHLVFRNGEIWLDRTELGPAPRVFQ